MKIIVFTAEDHNGGILQFAKEMVSALSSDSHNVVLFYLPNVHLQKNERNVIPSTIRYYQKKKNIIIKNKHINRIKLSIENENPDLVIFPENSPISLQVIVNLNKSVKKVVYIHDVTRHPSYWNIRKLLNDIYHKILMKKGLNKVNNVILLSRNSYDKFIRIYKRYTQKAIESTLCSHVPNVKPVKPMEIVDLKHYLLFFGRIDKYKGLELLVETYNTLIKENHDVPHLVIAGKGVISQQTQVLINNCSRITLVNRFIQDEEMVWLISNCYYVIMPYIEASQSGVLPIAYSFSKPVIVSSVNGLKEYVVNEKTGYVFKNRHELYTLLDGINSLKYDKDSIDEFYAKNFVMKQIMQKVLININAKL